ncbi:hypothetical protein C0995_005959 [Termitomyces sp. Mi166|nr:hypothetical protein C0995_005959 [Termitomyces sp. Mi166\
MIAHILRKNRANPCPNVSVQALKIAKTLKKGKGKRSKDEASENEADDEKEGRKPKKLLTKVEASMKQSQLKVFMVSGQLLDNANDVVTDQLKTSLQGKYVVLTSDGWKDESCNAVTGVNLAVNEKTYLVNLILANLHRKDGDAMCHAFETMIDKAEEVYGMYVVALCCDNDNGNQHGRKNVVLKQPYLFGPLYCAHQSTNFGKVLAFLVANMTHWNTHFIAFDHLQDLKTLMQLAVFTQRNDIIAAQKHMMKAVADGMMKRIEKRWKALDQPIFMLALILNPFKGVSCFSPKAGVSPFTLHTILMETYRCVCSQPPKITWTDVEEERYHEIKLRKEKEVSEAFFSYLSRCGPFEDLKKNKKTFLQINGNNPLAMWTAFLPMVSVAELADFAILLLSISVNQAGLEHNFSDLKIKKPQL